MQYICIPSVDISLYERGQHTNTLPFYLALLGTRFRARFRATGKRRHMEIRLTACGKPSYGLFPSLIPERSSSLCFWQGDKQLKSQDKEKEPQAKA